MLVPALASFRGRLRSLVLGTSYDGLQLAGVGRAELLSPCFECLVGVVREAGVAAAADSGGFGGACHGNEESWRGCDVEVIGRASTCGNLERLVIGCPYEGGCKFGFCPSVLQAALR